MTASTEQTLRATSWEVDLVDPMGRPDTRKVDGLEGGWVRIEADGVRIDHRGIAFGTATEATLAEEFFPHDTVGAVRRYVRDVPAFTNLAGELEPIPWCAAHDHPAVTDDDPILGRECEVGLREDSRVACRIVRSRGSNAEVSSWAETAVGR